MKNNNNNYNEKRKKEMVQIWNGLLPNCILREWNCIAIQDFVLQ